MTELRRWTLLDAQTGILDGGFSLERAAPHLASMANLNVTSRLLAGPGEARTFRVALELLPGAAAVASACGHIEELQGETPPRLHRATGVPCTAA